MQVKPSQATLLVTQYIKAGLVPLIEGSPGIGKSQIVHQIASEYGLQVLDLRLSQCDPTDLLGPLSITGKRASYLPMDTFPLEGDPVPSGFNGWLLFLDELTSASPAVQAASYKVILDRQIGLHKLHKNVAIVCAGNKEDDNAIVQPMSTALQSRLVHLELVVDAREWCDWGARNNLDHRITSFINFKPGNLYTFHPDHTDKTYACPRTWEFTHRILQGNTPEDSHFLPMLAGTLGEGVAREFVGFLKIHSNLPKIQDILANPEEAVIPDEPSILFALCGSLSHNAQEKNLAGLMHYIPRLPMEFQVVCVKEMINRNRELLKHPALQGWITKNAMDLF